jgi:hypothetical protein
MYDITLWCICYPLFNCFKSLKICDFGNTVLITKCEFHFLLKFFLPCSDICLVVMLNMCPEMYGGVHIKHLLLLPHSYLLHVHYREDKNNYQIDKHNFLDILASSPTFLLPVYSL